MISRAQKIRLGIFVAVSMGILMALLVAVVGSSLWVGRDAYRVRYQISVSGLEIGAPVKYNGVRVGRVERIEIDPDDVSYAVVTISLQAGTPVKKNARAILNVQGITGLKFIELIGGTSKASTLEPGSEVQAGTSVVDKLTGQAENISVKAELLINQLMELTDQEKQTLVNEVLGRTADLLKSLDRMVTNSSDDVELLVKNLANASSRLSAVLEESRWTIKETREVIRGIRQATKQVLDANRLSDLMDQAQGAMQEIRSRFGKNEMGNVTRLFQDLLSRTDTLVERLDLVIVRSREDLQSSMRYLAEAAENFRDFSRLIREDPSRLLRRQERPERVLP